MFPKLSWMIACPIIYFVEIGSIALAAEDPFPYYPIDWNQDVLAWWSHHPYNPQASKPFEGPAQTEPQINVNEVRAKHPDSTTAGIEESLQMLPPTGGTLWFPKEGSPYILTKDLEKKINLTQLGGTVLILRRGNLNFISDGAEIRSRKIAFGFSSMEHADSGKLTNPVSNLYFKNLTFNGDRTASCAIIFNHVRNVLIDNCLFTNYTSAQEDLGKVNLGIIRAETKSEDIWLRKCEFDSGWGALFFRGVHGGGAVNCTFKLTVSVNLLTQDEALKYIDHQGSCQYIVIANSAFKGSMGTAVSMYGSSCLIIGNTAETCGEFVVFRAHWTPIVQNTQYTYYGNQIIDNTVNQANVFLKIEPSDSVSSQLCEVSNSTVRGNKVSSVADAVVLAPKVDSVIRAIEITHNSFTGKQVPKIRIVRLGVTDIRVNDNDFFGDPDEVLVLPEGESLPDGVVFEKNRINNVLKL